jgi:hypothetical protein
VNAYITSFAFICIVENFTREVLPCSQNVSFFKVLPCGESKGCKYCWHFGWHSRCRYVSLFLSFVVPLFFGHFGEVHIYIL